MAIRRMSALKLAVCLAAVFVLASSDAVPPKDGALDLVFVVDNTGSMVRVAGLHLPGISFQRLATSLADVLIC